MAEALKPCPFCGVKPVLRRAVEEYEAGADGSAGEYDAHFRIDCDACGISVGDEYRSEAVASWNHRSPDLLGELKRMVEHFGAWAGDRSEDATCETWAALHCAKAAIERAES